MARRDIIVMGASVGGLSTVSSILATLPWDFAATIFVLIHTSDEGPGLLPKIFNRCSKLPVVEAINKAAILPGRVYVAPPDGRHLIVERDQVHLLPGPKENRHRPSVDALFRSAARAYGKRVIGVVLTGYLDDGSAGLADIKARGGIAIVQDPDDAEIPSMPLNAMQSIVPDYCLTAAEIGARLVALAAEDVDDSGEEGKPESSEIVTMPGNSGSYPCPECGGVLEQVRERKLLRFRCRVGHIYSPESLHQDQMNALESALWAAIRSLEEHAELSDRLAQRSSVAERLGVARRFSHKAAIARENARVLRGLLEKTAEALQAPAELPTGT